MNFILQIWFTVVSMFCQSYPNLSAPPPNVFPTSGVLPQLEMFSDATDYCPPPQLPIPLLLV